MIVKGTVKDRVRIKASVSVSMSGLDLEIKGKYRIDEVSNGY